jgi:hypothetical protein
MDGTKEVENYEVHYVLQYDFIEHMWAQKNNNHVQ